MGQLTNQKASSDEVTEVQKRTQKACLHRLPYVYILQWSFAADVRANDGLFFPVVMRIYGR